MVSQTLRDRVNEDLRIWVLYYRVHATRRMFQRNFEEADLFSCLKNGKIIEEYDTDLPFPSALINGTSVSGRAMHVVIGIDSGSRRLYIITVYEPDTSKWRDNYSRRIKI